MSYCLNCGSSLLGVNAQNVSSSSPDSVPTMFSRANPPSAPFNQQANFETGFQPPPVAKKGKTGFYLAIFGGVGLILLLVVGGIVGMVAMNWDKITGDDRKVQTNTNGRSISESNKSNTSVKTNTNQKNANVNAAPPNNSTANLAPSFTPDAADDSAITDNANSSDDAKSPTEPNATFGDLRVDYDVKEKGQNGMRIHTNFTVNNLKGVDSYLAIYFETKDGKRLQDKNKRFYSEAGEVAVYGSFKPGYDVTDYKDTTIFMPYDELDLGRGKYELRMDVDLIYKDGTLIQHLTYYYFDFSQ